jgi:xylulokinase
MDNALFLGIDLGTSSIKFAVQDSNEDYIYEDSVVYNFERLNEDWTEINPNKWWELIFNQLQEIFSFPWSDNLVALALTGQMHTTVFVDENGQSVRNAIMWNDKRTKENIQEIKHHLNRQCSTKVNAQIIAPGSPLANLLWMRDNEPQNFEKIDKFMIAKDFINFKLTGIVATDYCDASTSSMYDFADENWSKDVKEIFEIPTNIYPPIYHSSKKIGVIKPEIMKQLKITQDIDVYVGTGDNASTYFASESFDSKSLLISIGTSGVTLLPSNSEKLSKTGKNIAFKLFPEDQYTIVQGSISTGGKSLSWWSEEILKTEDLASEQAGIQQETIVEAKEIFIPYMTGEKYIYKNNSFKGTFLNITPSTSRKRMTLSVLEGVAFAMKNLSETLTDESYDEIKIIGGGAKSDLWKKIIANVFQKSIKDYSYSANAVIGAIKIAKAGYYGKHLSGMAEGVKTTRSDKYLVEKYNEKYAAYTSAVKWLNQYYQQ